MLFAELEGIPYDIPSDRTYLSMLLFVLVRLISNTISDIIVQNIVIYLLLFIIFFWPLWHF